MVARKPYSANAVSLWHLEVLSGKPQFSVKPELEEDDCQSSMKLDRLGVNSLTISASDPAEDLGRSHANSHGGAKR